MAASYRHKYGFVGNEIRKYIINGTIEEWTLSH